MGRLSQKTKCKIYRCLAFAVLSTMLLSPITGTAAAQSYGNSITGTIYGTIVTPLHAEKSIEAGRYSGGSGGGSMILMKMNTGNDYCINSNYRTKDSSQHTWEGRNDGHGMENHWQTRKDYQTARERYWDSKSKYYGLENKTVLKNAKDYLDCGNLMVEEWIFTVKDYIESSDLDEEEKRELISNLNNHMNTFEEHNKDLMGAGSPEQIRHSAREMQESWIKAKRDTRNIIGKIVCLKLYKVIQEGKDVESQMGSRIETLKRSGHDTDDLEAMLTEYSKNLELANESLDRAVNLYESGDLDNCREAPTHLRYATDHTRMAFDSIEHFFDEFKNIKDVVG